MVCLENLMYRCRYQTDISVWINCILYFYKGKREWKWCPRAPFSLFGSKQKYVWQTSICLKPTSQTIHCICLCLPIVLYPTHDICIHVCSASWDTRPGLLCRLNSTTLPRYAVSSEPWAGHIPRPLPRRAPSRYVSNTDHSPASRRTRHDPEGGPSCWSRIMSGSGGTPI